MKERFDEEHFEEGYCPDLADEFEYARKVLEEQSMRPWTAWQKGHPTIVLTETSSPRAKEM